MSQKVQQGINVTLYTGGKAVAGQQNVTFNRNKSSIDITNQITGNWAEKLSGLKTWSITCNGMYVVDADSLSKLETSFSNDEDITVVLQVGTHKYKGKALIVDMPLSSGYNDTYKYSVKLLGNGELTQV